MIILIAVLFSLLLVACLMEIRKQTNKVQMLLDAIREHRDARGNDRCWIDDEKLYRLIPDHQALTLLPEKDMFLGNCARFHANRQHPYHLSLFCGG